MSRIRRRRRRGPLRLGPAPVRDDQPPPINFWANIFRDPVPLDQPEFAVQPPMQLPDPLADLIVDLDLQPQDLRWPPEDL